MDLDLGKVLVHENAPIAVNSGNSVPFSDSGYFSEQPQYLVSGDLNTGSQPEFYGSLYGASIITNAHENSNPMPNQREATTWSLVHSAVNHKDTLVLGTSPSGSSGNSEMAGAALQGPDDNPKPKPFQCIAAYCNAAFTRYQDLRRHVKNHEPPTLYCLESGCRLGFPKGFNRFDKLISHQKNKHDLGRKHVRWGYRRGCLPAGSNITTNIELDHLVEMPLAVDKTTRRDRSFIELGVAGYGRVYKTEIGQDGKLRWA